MGDADVKWEQIDEWTRPLRELLAQHPEWEAVVTSTSNGHYLTCSPEHRPAALLALSEIGWDMS